jgi:hypothetical protein
MISEGDFVSKESQPGVFGRVEWVTEELVGVHWNGTNWVVPCWKSELVRAVPLSAGEAAQEAAA